MSDFFILLEQNRYTRKAEAVVKRQDGVYPEYSVLAGQPKIRYVKTYPTLELALMDYPNVPVYNRFSVPKFNSVSHLLEEDY